MSDFDAAGVGAGSGDDFVLSPIAHVAEFESSAPRLSTLLAGTRFQHLARQYEEADQVARAAQREFKKWVGRANLSVLLTATFSALLMAVSLLDALLGEWTRPLLVLLAILSVASGAFASTALNRVKQGQLLEDWMTGRARAETQRLSYFSAVTGAADDPLDVELEGLKLEYFRRFQLDMQIAYYRIRSRQHRTLADRTADIASWSVFLAGVASGAAGILGALATEWAALGVLAVFGTALQAFAAAREGTRQDRRNAERYARTLYALESLWGRLDDVRKGVATGSHSVLVEYVAAVQAQISLEHRQWLEEADSTKAALAGLERALEQAAEGADDEKPGS